MTKDYDIALEVANEYKEIFNEIERIIDFSDDYDDDQIEHMERYAIDLDENLTPNQKVIFYNMINDLQSY